MRPSWAIYMLAFNFTQPPFRGQSGAAPRADPRGRPRALVRYLKYDMYEPADTLMPPLPGYEPQQPEWASSR